MLRDDELQRHDDAFTEHADRVVEPRVLDIDGTRWGERHENWVGNTQSDDDWLEESWSGCGDRDEALSLFADWHHQVRSLIAGTEQVFKWALFDQPPLTTWTRERVTLLADAAHPMVPYMAQCAGQSTEVSSVLAACLAADRDDPQRAIAGYATRRQERTALSKRHRARPAGWCA
jgi:2-polyprenyl-6-methoxyphenol hydroxylase-like FAD-dependent oxidoreductase